MDTLLKADIFFFISSVVAVAGGVVLVVAGVYLIKILRDISYVSKRVRREADGVIDDVHEARSFVKKELKQALDIKELVGGIVQTVFSKRRKRSPRKKK